jgi:hypothetical protein
MELQYISDAAGNHTAVVIPIKDWEELTHQYADLKKMESKPGNIKPSDFEGSIPSDVADAMQAYVKESRESWG